MDVERSDSIPATPLITFSIAALLVYGSYSLTRAKYDVFPNFAPPEVAIQTEAPGLSPEQVETLVTQPPNAITIPRKRREKLTIRFSILLVLSPDDVGLRTEFLGEKLLCA